MRGIAAGPIRNSSSGPARSISETIKEAQNAVQAPAQAILGSENKEGGNGDVSIDEQTRDRNQLTWELARNLVGEELVLYPAMERYLRDGKEMVEDNQKLHDAV